MYRIILIRYICLNDTIITAMRTKQQEIIKILLQNGQNQASGIHLALLKNGQKASLVTVKRALSQMAKAGLLDVSGSGPSTAYALNTFGRLFAQIDAREYCAIEPDKRFGLNRFNFDTFPSIPPNIFSDEELSVLNEATAEYRHRTSDISATIQKKELERLVIELSWKSSKIEGNTYTLLDTEKLILKNQEAPGHDKRETRMILNHKDAFEFVHQHKKQFKNLSRSNVEHVHSILIKGLSVKTGVRQKPVGVLGSKYQPLDNVYQINEALETLFKTILRLKTPCAKALISLLGISYIQPFEDGNKRTARLMANAILLAHNCAPLSYRSVDENEYREAMLVFYEINSIVPFKKIFINQYDFAAKNYTFI